MLCVHSLALFFCSAFFFFHFRRPIILRSRKKTTLPSAVSVHFGCLKLSHFCTTENWMNATSKRCNLTTKKNISNFSSIEPVRNFSLLMRDTFSRNHRVHAQKHEPLIDGDFMRIHKNLATYHISTETKKGNEICFITLPSISIEFKLNVQTWDTQSNWICYKRIVFLRKSLNLFTWWSS